jgi:hypothetical protein
MKIDQLVRDQPQSSTPRPKELGDAYFWIHNHLIDISPSRNHRDWLLAHAVELELPGDISERPTRALWEGYKKGIIRIVWDRGGQWSSGAAHGRGNVLYVNGFPRDVWANIKGIMNCPIWQGVITTVVIEYVREVNGRPNWYLTDIFQDNALESLYRGRRPRRERVPVNAVFGGEPALVESLMANRMMNVLNDHSEQNLFEMFDQHFFSPGFFDILKNPANNKILNAPLDRMGLLQN